MTKAARDLLNARSRITIGGPPPVSIDLNALPIVPSSDPRARDAVMRVVALSDVAIEPIRWLWPNYLPFAKLVVLDGFPGQGKSTFAVDIAARLSRGRAMPDGSGGGNAGDTLILTYEDDAADTVRPRLEAAGGDAKRVHHVPGVSRHGDNLLIPPSLPQDLKLLESALRERPNIQLVVIDPLSAALGGDVDSHKDQDVRRVLSRLARIAAETGVCVIIIRHVRKSPGGNAITAGGGSIGIIGQARVGLILDRHPEDPNAAVLAVTKSNVGTLAASLAFRKESVTLTSATGAALTTSRLEWIGRAEMSADELLASRDEGTHQEGRDVADWLREVLAGGEPLERKAVMRAAQAAGFPERTVDRAAKRLGLVRTRSGAGLDHKSYWSFGEKSKEPTSATSATPVVPAEVAEVTAVGGSETEACRSFGCSTCDRRFFTAYAGDPCVFCRRQSAARSA